MQANYPSGRGLNRAFGAVDREKRQVWRCKAPRSRADATAKAFLLTFRFYMEEPDASKTEKVDFLGKKLIIR